MCNKVLNLINNNLSQLEHQCKSMLCNIQWTRDFINNHIIRKQVPCRNLQHHGYCKYGEHCWFKHINISKSNNNSNNNKFKNSISNTHNKKKFLVKNVVNSNNNCNNIPHNKHNNHNHNCHKNHNINNNNNLDKENNLKKNGNIENIEEKEEENYSNNSKTKMEINEDHKNEELFEKKNNTMEKVEKQNDIKINTNNNIIKIVNSLDNNFELDNISNISDVSSSSSSSSIGPSIKNGENRNNQLIISKKYKEARKLFDEQLYKHSLNILNDLIENRKYKKSLKNHPLVGEIYYLIAYIHNFNGKNDLALEILEETYMMELAEDVQERIDNLIDQVQPEYYEEDDY